MTVTYCSAADVAAFLQFNQTTGFSTSTKPTQAQVEMLINAAEDYVDTMTNRAWRAVAISDWEYYDLIFQYRLETGLPVYLKHRAIRALVAASGDAFEVWNGSTWDNWLVGEVEGRANDYWFDYAQGILYMRAGAFGRGALKVRIKYRYGETTVNGMVKLAAIKLTAADIVTGMDGRSIVLPEGSTQVGPERKAQMWREEAAKLLQPLVDPMPIIPSGATMI